MLADFFDQLEAIHLGQHAVDNGDVVRPRKRQREAGVAVGGFIDHMAGLLQALNQVPLCFEIVFHNKDAHRLRLLRVTGRGSAPAAATGGWGHRRRHGYRTGFALGGTRSTAGS